MLEFSGEWRYDSPGAMPSGVKDEFRQLIDKICVQGPRKQILEHFKRHFASAAGVQHHDSSSVDWASTDLERVMSEASENAPLFLEAFYDACEALKSRCPGMAMPGVERINRILSDHKTRYQIDPPNLVTNKQFILTSVPSQPTTLDFRRRARIEDAINASDRALTEVNVRPAVLEMLWALETTSTLFRDEEIHNENIDGDYFNEIIRSLQKRAKGHQKRILEWMMNLHGYLSSPRGGGIRHGVDLWEESSDLDINEARLICNLIRSYLTYLISEYERLRQNAG